MQKIKRIQGVITDLTEDRAIGDFLGSQKKSTRATYAAYLRRLKEFAGESSSAISLLGRVNASSDYLLMDNECFLF